MHADELETDASLVRRLLARQFPRWADLPIVRVESSGTENAIYRLGGYMAVRLPRIAAAATQVDKEAHWLPILAPRLPLAIPAQLARGIPAEGYPWHWSVCTWLAGENAAVARIDDLRQAAIALAQFVSALQQIDTSGGPSPDAHNYGRGAPLATRDERTRDALARLEGEIDTRAAAAAWDAALNAAQWSGPPVWIHGDLQPSNLLINAGRITAVIDFSCLGVGDPACDLMLAWTLLSGESRDAFREALAVDDATWARARGWTLSTALIALPYYMETNPEMVREARHKIASVLADQNPQ